MVIGVCTLELQVPDSASLKQKRQVIRSVMARLRQQYNIALAEVDHQDSWQLATLAMVAVSSDLAYVQGLLQRAVDAVEGGRHGLVLLDYSIEVL